MNDDSSIGATLPADAAAAIRRLVEVMAKLRDPDGGCPWDLEQDFASIAPYTLEEAHEVADAIARDDMGALKEELGDLLLQVVFHARMAEEAGYFDFAQVAATIAAKMERRHPNVFGGESIESAVVQTRAWEQQKQDERAAKAASSGQDPSALDGVALGFPALLRAAKLQARASRVGFDWPDVLPVFDKIAEEVAELKAEIKKGAEPAKVEEELGDLLFALVNLARHLELDAEAALRRGNAKFEARFRAMETLLRTQGRNPAEVNLEIQEAAWQAVKARETR
ncbi:MAG: nucleoside triphosphate pyrophosphohydrolase [Kiloniellales bacterium]